MQSKRKRHKHYITVVLLGVGLWVSHAFTQGQNVCNGQLFEKTYTIKTVVIDPGHGGRDGGCSGASHREKHVVLDIALRLGKYIEEQTPDVKVLYTRKSDRFVTLKNRALFANRNNADLFISIHCNSARASAYGTETFVLGLHRTEDNLRVAMRENNSIILEDDYNQHYGNFNPSSPEAYIIFSLHQNAYLNQSLHLASAIETEFATRAGRHSRGVKQAGFLVLRETAMPSVLVETGFLTNRNEEKFLASNQGKDYIASAIFRAFRDVKKEFDKEAVRILAQRLKQRQWVDESTWPWPSLHSKNTEGKHYFVQLFVSSNGNKGTADFAGWDNMAMEYIWRGKVYKYVAGPYATTKEAEQAREKAVSSGFRDAFVLIYDGEKRLK